VEVCAIQLPGRGARLFESPATSIDQIVQPLIEAFRPYLQTPCALFGHSLGALVAFEFARRLRALDVRPVHLFVSGRRAPHMPDHESPVSHLPIPEFVETVRSRYQAIPDDLLKDPEMMSLCLPALVADMKIDESYEYTETPPLACPISCFGGLHDSGTTDEGLRAWQDHTSDRFALKMIPGGHFFIDSAREDFVKGLAEELERSLAGLSMRGIP
jgi:medium-chain acyl-[acyl-carrier-protein] hydrolase